MVVFFISRYDVLACGCETTCFGCSSKDRILNAVKRNRIVNGCSSLLCIFLIDKPLTNRIEY